MARIRESARLTAVVSVVVLAAACEFIRVAPVPGLPASQAQGPPPPISSLTTQQLCTLRLREGYFDEVIDELNARGEFSDFEMAQIRAARVSNGMGEPAVQCSFGQPQQVLTRSISDEYEKVYVYDRVFLGVQTRVFFDNGIVVGSEDNPRSGSF
jgi:hypothetical protein